VAQVVDESRRESWSLRETRADSERNTLRTCITAPADSDVDVLGDLIELPRRAVSRFASATLSAFGLLDHRENLVTESINLRRTNSADG